MTATTCVDIVHQTPQTCRRVALPLTSVKPERKEVRIIFEEDAFPSFRYNVRCIRDLSCRKNIQIPKYFTGATRGLSVIVAGDVTKINCRLLSKKKGIKDGNEDFSEEDWPVVPLVYFIKNDEEVKEAETEVSEISRSHAEKNQSVRPILVYDRNLGIESGKMGCTDFLLIPRSKCEIRKTVSCVLETPIFRMLQKIMEGIENEEPKDMKKSLEVEALLKRERKIWESDNSVAKQQKYSIPKHVVKYLNRLDFITAFGIWQNKFYIFCKNKLEETRQGEIRSWLEDEDSNFFSKMRPQFIHSEGFTITEFVKQGESIFQMSANSVATTRADAGSPKHFHGTIGAVLNNVRQPDRYYGLTAHHIFSLGAQAYIYIAGKPRHAGHCVFTDPWPYDMAIVEFNESLESIYPQFHDENERARKTEVYTDAVANVGKVHKKGAGSDWTGGVILSPELHVKIYDSLECKEFFVVEGDSGPFSSQGDSGSVIFMHSLDDSKLLALGQVFGGDLKLKNTTWEEILGRDVSDLTFATKINPSFETARKRIPPLDFKFDDVPSSSSDSDDSTS